MRAVVRRHRLRPGDSLVFGPPGGREVVSLPIRAVGGETVVLIDGTVVPCPTGKAVYIERPDTNLPEDLGQPDA